MFDLAVREDDWARADTLIRRKFPKGLPFDTRVVFAAMRKDTATLRQLRLEGQKTAGEKGRKRDRALEAGTLLATYLEDIGSAGLFTPRRAPRRPAAFRSSNRLARRCTRLHGFQGFAALFSQEHETRASSLRTTMKTRSPP